MRSFKVALVALIILAPQLCSPPFRAGEQAVDAAPVELRLPGKKDSVKFAVIGDSGTGRPPQFEIAARMVSFRQQFPFTFVLMLGDNIYGGHSPEDFRRKFEEPYQSLLAGGVKFYASLGNHDDPIESFYKPFHMDGKRYYSFHYGNVDFFALDSTYMSPEQVAWLRQELSHAQRGWKICYFHHPLYSDAKFHGADIDLRNRIEPILRDQKVDVVLSGHEHVYERLAPQHGIHYFVLGDSGELRPHDLRTSDQTAKGFDTDRTFGAFEVDGGQLHFQVVSRTGETVDSGTISRAEAGAR